MKRITSAPACIVISTLFFITYANLSSCTKTNTKIVTVQDTTILTVRDTTVIKDTVTPDPSILSLITGKQWEYDSVFTNYTGPGTGTLAYVRDGSGNIENLDNFYSTYTAEGNLWFVENGVYYLSQWNFSSNDSSTFTIVSSTFGTDYCRIVNLSAAKFTIYDSTNKVLDIEIIAP